MMAEWPGGGAGGGKKTLKIPFEEAYHILYSSIQINWSHPMFPCILCIFLRVGWMLPLSLTPYCFQAALVNKQRKLALNLSRL